MVKFDYEFAIIATLIIVLVFSFIIGLFWLWAQFIIAVFGFSNIGDLVFFIPIVIILFISLGIIGGK